MKVELNRSEQETVDRYDQLKEAQRRGEHVYDFQLAEAKQLAENARNNAAIRARQWAALDAQRQQEQQQREAQRQEEINAGIEAYKQRVRATFMGTQAEFEAQWPTIKAEWQRQQTADPVELEKQRLRATGLYAGF